MAKLSKIILIIFMLSPFFACKKDDDPKIARGRIIDAYTKLPLDSVSVYLYEFDKSSVPYTITVYNDTLSNTMGYYNFNFYKTGTFLTAFKDKYHNSAEYGVEYFLHDEKTIELHPNMYVNVRLIDIEKKWSTIQINALNNSTGSYQSVNVGPDPEFDSTISGLQVVENYYQLTYRLSTGSGAGTEIYENRSIPITLIPTDTVDVVIEF